MKTQVSRIITVIVGMILTMSIPLWAQAPQSFNYQAIVRDASGQPIADQMVAILIKIRQGSEAGPVVYCETHSAVTSPLGLVNLQIGTGTVITGSFPGIGWEAGPYYLELELDPSGGTSYVSMGTTQLVSVPYALFSEKTGQEYSAGSGIDITDHQITNTAPDQVVTLSNGTGVYVTGAYPNFTISNAAPDQVVSLAPGAGISTGGTYPDFTVTNTAPNANHTGDASGSEALTVTGIQGRPVSSVAPATEQVLQWNGSQWIPATVSSGGGTDGWSLTGNSGTNPSVNFLGTTDNQPLKFRVNNLPAGEINPTTFNTALGAQALYYNTSGVYNVAVGYQALYHNKVNDGSTAFGHNAMKYANNSVDYPDITYNTAVGFQALMGSMDPASNTGTKNTALGFNSLAFNTSGSYNTSCGSFALCWNTTGSENAACGENALLLNTTGNSNSAFGNGALVNNRARNRSTAIGYHAMYQACDESIAESYSFNTAVGCEALRGSLTPASNTGKFNTALGDQALFTNTSGSNNSATGYKALNANSTGNYNTSNGYQSLYSNTTGSWNTAIGQYALYSNQAYNRSTAIGYGAMQYAYDGTATGQASLNTAVGYEALRGSTNPGNNTGTGNTAVGDQALGYNTSGTTNTAVGHIALASNSSGTNNVAIGHKALQLNNTGNSNTAMGNFSLEQASTADNNTAIGQYACWATNLGNNTAVGISAGDWYQFSYSTFLGTEAYTTGTGSFSNCMALGYNARVDASNKVLIGNTSITSIGGYAGWTNFSDGRYKENVREDVPGLEFINQLRPVTYTLDITSLNADLNKNRPATLRDGEMPRAESPEDIEGRLAKEKIVYTGFVAQEVEASARAIGYDFSGVDAPQNPDGHYGLRYAEFVVPLVKAIQEQQVMIEKQQRSIEALQEEVKRLKEEKR
jgi:hypothetical protein